MSGHSKWHSIKHKKAAVDAKRGKMFTRVIRELTIAAKLGGSDADANPRLRTAIQSAKDVNMPKDTMERAIKKGAGELEGETFEEVLYEGYGPAGTAIMVRCTTNNKNRTAAEIRHAFTKNGGNMGASGCVSYLFERKGIIEIEEAEEEQLMEVALEAGANDVENQGDGYFVVDCDPDSVQDVRETIEGAGFKIISSAAVLVPTTTAKAEGKEAEQVRRLIEFLEEYDDTDEVSSNAEFDEDEEE